MKQKLHFTKMQGAGNDYIYVDGTRHTLRDPSRAAILLSDRHFGIGSDGLVIIGAANVKGADFSMRIFNADGSEGKMCGNAARCIGKYLYEKKLTDKMVIKLQTASGIKTIWIKPAADKAESVTVDMLQPQGGSGRSISLEAGGRRYSGRFISMGNPHFVIKTDDAQGVDLPAVGPLLENHPSLPERSNIEFVQEVEHRTLRVRVWERGSGITLACGSGACASAVAMTLDGMGFGTTKVIMDGGELAVEWKSEQSNVYLSGPAEFVFEGDIDYKE